MVVKAVLPILDCWCVLQSSGNHDSLEMDLGHAPSMAPHANSSYSLTPDWNLPDLGHTPRANSTPRDRLLSPDNQVLSAPVPVPTHLNSGLLHASLHADIGCLAGIRIMCTLHSTHQQYFTAGLGLYGASSTTSSCQWLCQTELWY